MQTPGIVGTYDIGSIVTPDNGSYILPHGFGPVPGSVLVGSGHIANAGHIADWTSPIGGNAGTAPANWFRTDGYINPARMDAVNYRLFFYISLWYKIPTPNLLTSSLVQYALWSITPQPMTYGNAGWRLSLGWFSASNLQTPYALCLDHVSASNAWVSAAVDQTARTIPCDTAWHNVTTTIGPSTPSSAGAVNLQPQLCIWLDGVNLLSVQITSTNLGNYSAAGSAGNWTDLPVDFRIGWDGVSRWASPLMFGPISIGNCNNQQLGSFWTCGTYPTPLPAWDSINWGTYTTPNNNNVPQVSAFGEQTKRYDPPSSKIITSYQPDRTIVRPHAGHFMRDMG